MSFGVDAYTTLFCQQLLWCGMKINTKLETSEVALNFLLKFIYVLITYFLLLFSWTINWWEWRLSCLCSLETTTNVKKSWSIMFNVIGSKVVHTSKSEKWDATLFLAASYLRVYFGGRKTMILICSSCVLCEPLRHDVGYFLEVLYFENLVPPLLVRFFFMNYDTPTLWKCYIIS